ncbi:S1C family serine protease [Geodermatophilus sp. URMC 64]
MTEHGHPDASGQDPRTTPAGATPAQPAYGQPAAPQPAAQQPAAHQASEHPSAPAQPGVWLPPQAHQQVRPPTGQVFGAPAYQGAVPPGGSVPPPVRRSGRLRIGIAGLVAGAVIGGGAGAGVVALVDQPGSPASSAAAAQSVVIKDPNSATSVTAAAAKAAPSVVTIYVTGSSAAGSGSGVVLTDDGYVLTNNHVVTLEGEASNADIQVRTADGTLYDATVVGTDPSSDLAVVKLDGASGLTPATFADSGKVQVGDLAVAIGAPLGLENTVTDGIVSATNRAVQTGSTQSDATVIDAIQTDAAINPGNSGGALVNAAGEVIGINTAIASVASSDLPGQQSTQSGNIGVGFAIPSNTAKRIATEIIKTGSANHAVLGVSAQTATDGQNTEVGTGAEVVQVQAGSAAADAGLRAGDVITAVDDRPVTTSTELTAAVRSAPPGEKVTLTVRRGSDTTTVDVTLGTSTS